jgi:hypothetical protein
VPDAQEPLCQVRLRTGRELSVVDLSSEGALVEGARLLPGTHVDVHVTTRDGRVLVRSRVVRSYVASVKADAVQYRGALAFDRAIDAVYCSGYPVPMPLRPLGSAEGSAYPTATLAIASPGEHRLSA